MKKEFYLEAKEIVETIKRASESSSKKEEVSFTLKEQTVGRYMMDNATSLPDEVFIYEGYRLMR